MSSSRLILLFLAVFFIIIVILSSKRIADSLRLRFGKYLPSPFTTQVQEAKITISPSPAKFSNLNQTPVPTAVVVELTEKGTSVNETPKTGPMEFMWLVIGGGAVSGLILRRLSQKITEK